MCQACSTLTLTAAIFMVQVMGVITRKDTDSGKDSQSGLDDAVRAARAGTVPFIRTERTT